MTMELERNLLAAPQEAHAKVEIYSGVARLARTVWGSEVRAAGTAPQTAVVWCHPTANFLGHYSLPGLAERGVGGVGLTTRYVGNDTALILENCLLDIGSMVKHLRERGYEKIVLVGNSGGASIVPYYQAQAESPSVTSPPGGGPDLTQASLPPVDGIVMFNAHPSRARLCTEWLDPAIVSEQQPFERDAALDMYDPRNGPPFSADFVARYREGQRDRNRRISAWAEGQLRAIAAPGHFPDGLEDLAFVVPGTVADLRFLDLSIDPSDRIVGPLPWGPPETTNYMPAGIGRCTTLRSWLNQWSLDHTFGDALRWLPEISAPMMVMLGTADPLVVPQMAQQMYDATAGPRELVMVPGATHYFEDQPELLDQALDTLVDWLPT
ncbi:MAG: alpha/beta hydrolase [Acidimicrobiia bacterium]